MRAYKSWGITVVSLLFITIVAIVCMTSKTYISTIIVPHHNLVAKERSQLFEAVADREKNRRIILLSTNHYNTGKGTIQTRTTDFTTADNTIQIDDELSELALQNGVVNEPVTFETEHGVKTILPDIATYLRGSTIVPLIIKEDAPKQTISALLEKLHASCQDCLVIASVDFSHYQPYLLSELHDDLTRRGMQNVDTELIETKSEIGEPQVLSAAMQWAKLSGTERFIERNHTNATVIEHDYYAEGTTHFFGWYENGTKVTSSPMVSFTFVGDIMFDRNVRNTFHPNYYDAFNKLGNRVLWGTDVVMANLEGPITTKEKLSTYADMPRFTFSPLVVNTLTKLHFTDMALRNNHTLDAGVSGLDDTKTALTNNGFGYTDGAPITVNGSNQQIHIFNIDITLNDKLPIDDFKKLQNISDNIVVYIHWGPEYQLLPSASQQQIAHELIDAGADMIIGVGPHVVQPVEVYKNRPIMYSLGNFLFDMTDNEATKIGLIVTGKFTNNSIVLQPMISENMQLQPVLLRSNEADSTTYNYFKDLQMYQTDTRGGIQFTISK